MSSKIVKATFAALSLAYLSSCQATVAKTHASSRSAVDGRCPDETVVLERDSFVVVKGDCLAKPEPGQLVPKGGTAIPQRPIPRPRFPDPCAFINQCSPDGDLILCRDGNTVVDRCVCGCSSLNGKYVCRGQQCLPKSERVVTYHIDNTTVTEICEDDGCGWRRK